MVPLISLVLSENKCGTWHKASPSSFQKSATMLNHKHKQTFWKLWKEDSAYRC